jgi:hypothetical protein
MNSGQTWKGKKRYIWDPVPVGDTQSCTPPSEVAMFFFGDESSHFAAVAGEGATDPSTAFESGRHAPKKRQRWTESLALATEIANAPLQSRATIQHWTLMTAVHRQPYSVLECLIQGKFPMSDCSRSPVNPLSRPTGSSSCLNVSVMAVERRLAAVSRSLTPIGNEQKAQ